MDAGARESLRRALTLAVGVLMLLALVAWVVPGLFATLNDQGTEVVAVPKEHTLSTAEVDLFLADALKRLGTTSVIQREEEDGVIRGIYQLPRGAQTEIVAQRLRGLSDEAGLELYASPVDGLDLELRAYAGPKLRQQLLLVPDLPKPPRLKGAIRNPDRPMLSIVVTDVGKASIDKLLSVKAPITVAIEPYTPFALRTARIAASKWHEVIAHVPKNMTPQEAQRAVPLATGIWFDGTPVAPLGTHDVVVVPADEVSGASTPDAIRVLAAQRSDRRDAMTTLNRARHIATRMGRAAMVIEASDPKLGDVLTWSEQAHRQGYRVVMASEAARYQELRGPK
jgi:hypothetical protein